MASLSDILDEASSLALSADWSGLESRLLDCVVAVGELETRIGEFVAALPVAAAPETAPPAGQTGAGNQERAQPSRKARDGAGRGSAGPGVYLGPVLKDLTGQGEALAAVWKALPEANRGSVTKAVEEAVARSASPRLWAPLLRLVREASPRDPARLRELLGRDLLRAETSLTRSRQEAERLAERMARLSERIATETDPRRRHALEDLRRLTELDVEVCRARMARDECAIESLKERLGDPRAGGGV